MYAHPQPGPIDKVLFNTQRVPDTKSCVERMEVNLLSTTNLERDLPMKRNLIALTVITLGLAGNAAFAEPTLDLYGSQEGVKFSVPETTSYQAVPQAGTTRLTERDEFQPFNP